MKGTAETGQSSIETILISLLLLVPVIWALGVLADLHRSALAATSAAREAAFEASRSDSVYQAEAAVDRAVAQAFDDHDLLPRRGRVRFSMAPGLERGKAVEVQVSYPVTVLQAPLLGRVAGPSVWVNASHIARIEPYKSRE